MQQEAEEEEEGEEEEGEEDDEEVSSDVPFDFFTSICNKKTGLEAELRCLLTWASDKLLASYYEAFESPGMTWLKIVTVLNANVADITDWTLNKGSWG